MDKRDIQMLIYQSTGKSASDSASPKSSKTETKKRGSNVLNRTASRKGSEPPHKTNKNEGRSSSVGGCLDMQEPRDSGLGMQRAHTLNMDPAYMARRSQNWSVSSTDSVIHHSAQSSYASLELPNSTDPLPSGWSVGKTPEGRVFFINEREKTTTWLDPRTGRPFSGQVTQPNSRVVEVDTSPFSGVSLPHGWEMALTPDGLPYFIDHVNKRTSWEDPRSQAFMDIEAKRAEIELRKLQLRREQLEIEREMLEQQSRLVEQEAARYSNPTTSTSTTPTQSHMSELLGGVEATESLQSAELVPPTKPSTPSKAEPSSASTPQPRDQAHHAHEMPQIDVFADLGRLEGAPDLTGFDPSLAEHLGEPSKDSSYASYASWTGLDSEALLGLENMDSLDTYLQLG